MSESFCRVHFQCRCFEILNQVTDYDETRNEK
jgi:hypothetical protein